MHIQRQADSFAYRMAASLPTEDELSGLQKEFDDWWDAIPEEKRPRPDGNCAWNFNNSPITSWENVEKFLSEHYPQAHSGAEWSEDAIGSAMGKNYPDYVRPVSDQRTLANMIMLHRRSQGLGLPNRGAWTPDEAALYSTPGMAEAIVKGRNKMQRDYEQRNMVHANTIRCAVDDYRGYHRGPDAEYGSSMDNPDGVFPDIDTHPEYYDTYQPYDYESHHQIRRVRGKPDAWVTVYRALPFSVIQNKTYRGGPNDLYEGSKPYRYRQREAPINTNDWVTPSYSYAKEHGEANLSNEPWTIVQQRVRARSLFSEGNSIHEWAYNGEPIVGTEGDRARRERGLRTRNRLSHNTIRCAISPSQKAKTLDEMSEPDLHLPIDEVRQYANKWYGPQLKSQWFFDTAQYPGLRKEVEQNGIQRPLEIATDGRRAQLWDGYHRLALADHLGHETVPVKIIRRPPSWFTGPRWFNDLKNEDEHFRYAPTVPVGEGLRAHLQRK